MGIKVQFELSLQPGVPCALSDIYGPFDFAHVVDDELRVGPDGEVFAILHEGGWQIASVAAAETTWSNVILFAVVSQPPVS